MCVSLHSGEVLISSREMPSDHFAASVLRASADTVAVLTADGRVRFLSTTAPRWLGRDPQAWVGRVLVREIHPQDVRRFTELLQIVDGDGPRRDMVQVRMLAEDGQWLTVEAHGFTYIDLGEHAGFVVSLRDVDGQMRAMTARSLAERTLDATADGGEVDNRQLVLNDVLPALVQPSGLWSTFGLISVRIANFDTACEAIGRGRVDDAVRALAKAASTAARQHDFLCRLQDRRLLIVCPGLATAPAATRYALRMQSAFRDVHVGDQTLLETKIGFAFGSTGDNLHELLAYALDAEQIS